MPSATPTVINPPANFAYSEPIIQVEIWPHNGGQYTFTGANNSILAAQISKNIRNKNGGSFILELAPGGPVGGVNSSITWTSVLTPASLVIISLSRGGSLRTVMMGIITSIKESQIWDNRSVQRTIQIAGMDFTYFFNTFSYYQLSYLALIANQPSVTTAGYLLGQAGKAIVDTPDKVSSYWFNYVMMGTDTTTSSTTEACLQTTYVMYQNRQIFLHKLFASWFEPFNEVSTVYIPLYQDLLNAEGSWLDKFLAFLPFPFYEFFITTAESGDYPSATAASLSISTPTGFTSVSPTLVARVNPLPWVTYPTIGVSSSSQLNNTRWNNLPTYSLGNFSYIESEVEYNTEEVANFLGIQTLVSDQIAGNQGNTSALLMGFELYGGVIDRASINNYGFRPQFASLRWSTLPSAVAVASGTFDLKQAASTLIGKLASYYIPTPNMLEGKIMIPMWPDILPGNKYLEQPFKNTDVYEFYIEGVTHTYVFGGRSQTTLDVSRGLKKSDYDSPTNLIGLHIDTYAPIDGVVSARSNVTANPAAYYVNPATVGNLGLGASPYYSIPPGITINSVGVTPAGGWPHGATSFFDAAFMTAASACGTHMDWRNLKAQAIAESSINQAAISSAGAVGIMQVLPSAHPEYDPVQLVTDPFYNIMAGGQIMCGLLSTYGSFDQALRHYISGDPDHASAINKAKIASYVATVNRYALAAGVSNTA